jgi:hypothetical protein
MYDPNATAVDQNFLFGLLALQADLITRDHFLEGCREWAEQKELSLPRLFVQRGWLRSEDRREVERLVERKLARHGGDVRACLADLANNPLQNVFVSLQNGEFGLALPPAPPMQQAARPVDGRQYEWSDRNAPLDDQHSDHGQSFEGWSDTNEQPARRKRSILGSAAVIVAAILAAVVLGVVLVPLIQQVHGGGKGGNDGGLFRGLQPDDPRLAERGVRQLVHGLFLALGKKDDVLAHIQQDPMLTDAQRERAAKYAKILASTQGIEMSGTLTITAQNLNNGSWFIVRQPGDDEKNCRKALQLAEAAVKLEPRTGEYVNTLGVAQYRVGNYAEAMKTLIESNRLDSRKYGHSIGADLAFLAMAAFHLGNKANARDYLNQLREELSQEDDEHFIESQAFLREAEQVIEGKATSAPSPRPKKRPATRKVEITA